MYRALITLLGIGLFCSPALAQDAQQGKGAKQAKQTKHDKKDQKPVAFSGEVFSHYGIDLTEGADLSNEFDIDRVYLTAKAKLGGRTSVRFTTDVGREKPQHIELPETATDPAVELEVPEEEKIRLFMKYAYLEWKPAAVPDLKLRFGSAGTPYPGYADKFWGHRFVSKSFADNNKLLPTADIGVHVLGKHADGLLDWHVALVNGEGYSKAEIDASKTADLRVSVDPLAQNDGLKLPISAIVEYEFDLNGGDTEFVYGGAVGFKQDYITVWGEGMLHGEGDVSGTGISAMLMPTVPDVMSVYGRIDLFDPDSDTDDDDTTRLIAGVSRGFTDHVFGALQFENESEAGESAQAVTVRGRFKF